MPTYEYACLACHRHIEASQTFSDDPLRECDECGGPLRRVFHPVGIVLKGSGFYSTDSRRSKKAAPEPAKKKEEAPAAGPSAPGSGSSSAGSGSSSAGPGSSGSSGSEGSSGGADTPSA